MLAVPASASGGVHVVVGRGDVFSTRVRTVCCLLVGTLLTVGRGAYDRVASNRCFGRRLTGPLRMVERAAGLPNAIGCMAAAVANGLRAASGCKETIIGHGCPIDGNGLRTRLTRSFRPPDQIGDCARDVPGRVGRSPPSPRATTACRSRPRPSRSISRPGRIARLVLGRYQQWGVGANQRVASRSSIAGPFVANRLLSAKESSLSKHRVASDVRCSFASGSASRAHG